MIALKSFFRVAAFSIAILSFSSICSAADFDAAAKYAQTCAVCHNSGAAGAPRKGDAAAWQSRVAQGEDSLLAAVKNGKGAMPAKGLCTDCSDAQFQALIQYMMK